MSRRIVFLVVMYLVVIKSASGIHILGGELSYKYISGDSYRIRLTLYVDCGSGLNKTMDKSRVNAVVSVYDGNAEKTQLHLLKEQNTGNEIPIVCAKDQPNTSCNGGSLPGVMEYIFSREVKLPYKSADWKFIFKGELTSAPSAGRATSITNLSVNPAGTYMYLEATLNNSYGNNSTPQYTALPAAYFCVNIQHQYDPGALDMDFDSLEFILEPAYEAASTPVKTVPYMPGYSALNPLHCRSFAYHAQNGSITFLPDILQHSIVVQRTLEYRSGEIIGSSMRELAFLVVDCNNSAPGGNIDTTSITGGVVSAEYTISTCRGIDALSFDLLATDKNDDNIKVTSSGLPPGSTLKVLGNSTPTPKISFYWPDVKLPGKEHRFFIHLLDDGCPLVAARTITVVIKPVDNSAYITHTVLEPTGCVRPQHLQFNVVGGAVPRQLEVKRGNTVVEVLDDTSGVVEAYLRPGSYIVSILSQLPCNETTYSLDVIDSGEYPFPPNTEGRHYCLYDPATEIKLAPKNGETIRWYDINGNLLPETPVYSTDSVKQFRWLVSSYYKACESKKMEFTIDIHPLPLCTILNTPGEICLGDKVLLTANGGAKYIWLPEDKVYKDEDSGFYARVLEPTIFFCIAISEYGCRDTVSVSYDNIIPCCTFSYPNAFTPNGDRINEGFRIVTHGNHEYYDLRIFDRWGKVVFSTNDPYEYWYGSYAGKKCEIGTYYYYFKSKCLTGRVEETKGEILLLR